MNVIISNKNKDLLSNLNVEIIKTLEGEYSSEEIINIFSSLFFSKMFLDITAIKNYKDIKEIQKLSMSLDASKIVLLLPNDGICNNNSYQSKLVNMGIYNFTCTLEGLNYLSMHSNAYRDVAHLQDMSGGIGTSGSSFGGNNTIKNKPTAHIEDDDYSNNIYNNDNGNINVYNYTNNLDKNCYVIGFKNITSHAGSTSLIYMLKLELSKFYSVVAIEVNRRDFIHFKDKDMISIRDNQLDDTLRQYSDRDIILLDLNDCNYELNCDDVLYLIEPSIIKLNKMIMINRNIFLKLSNKKIVLNKSMLTDSDVHAFEKESNSTIFYNIPPLNDRVENSRILYPLLSKMNLINVKDRSKDEKVMRLFKF